MPKGYRPYLPDQDLLLPPSLREWMAEEHLVYFVSDVVDQLDLSAIHAVYGEEKRGQPPYDPRLMTKLLVYGYCTGVFSSRRIQKRLQEDIPFKVLAAGNEPDFRTISDFRKIHVGTLQGLFEQVLEMALEVGAVKVGRVTLDGTKVKANASKHKAMSYGRMKEKQEQLRDEVKQLLEQAEAADEEEDRRHGSQRGDELPEELRRRETRLAKIKIAKKVVEQRAREKAAAEGKSAAEAKRAKPDDKDQYNFTDPESRIMKGADGFVQGYNAQASVEPEMLLIVGQSVTEAANDKQQLEPMVEAIEQQSGQRPKAVLADSGYCSEENLAYLESADQPERKIDGFIATGKQKHGEHRLPCKPGPLPKGATKVDRMKRKLQTKVGKAVYAARKCVVEPVFGQIKQARGFRQFLLRGKDKVKGEWALVCLTHNILRLHAAIQPAERHRRMFSLKIAAAEFPGAIWLAGTPRAGVSRRIRATQGFGSPAHRALFLGQAPRCGRKSPVHSDPARSFKIRNHRALPARHRHGGAFDHQSIGTPGPARHCSGCHFLSPER
jgi:transposase